MSVFGFKMNEPVSAPKRPWILIVSVLIVISLGAFTLAKSLQPAADFPGDGSGQVSITIQPGDTLSEIGNNTMKKFKSVFFLNLVTIEKFPAKSFILTYLIF